MKKVCVSTYCEWNSYGSMMQSLALKKVLYSIGCESVVVRDNPAPAIKLYMPLKFNKNIKRLTANVINRLLKKQICHRYEKSLRFINEHLDVLYYNDYETLKKNPPEADVYLAGSDQIWHPDLCSPLFFLDFVNDSKKFSYAASMGKTSISDGKQEQFAKLVDAFDTISVREDSMVEVIQKFTNKKISVNIDPTFLINAEEWRTFHKPYCLKRPYILVYAIYWDKNLNKQLKKLGRNTGYDIVALCTSASRVWANKKIYDASPEQFLWLIDHAEAIVSSSFHGIAFSLIFNKRLAPVINPQHPSRMNTILSKLNIDVIEIENLMEFDLSCYNVTNRLIDDEREKSIKYLKEIVL